MTRKKIPVFGKYSLRRHAEEEGKLKVNGTGRTSKLFSPYKSYDQSSRKPTNFSRGMNALYLPTECIYTQTINK